MEKDIKLMKGNDAIAEAAIRAGADAYFGYPITPQSEVIEYLMAEQPEKRTGMVVLQAESEVAAINMIYGAAGAGKRVLTTSSSPGISLMQEGISYIAGAQLPCVLVNVVRGGPGLGTIQPSQADYFQSVKGGGHGDYKLIVLAPASVQESVDFIKLAFDIAFKYRNPVMLLTDGVLGQMMEKVEFFEQQERKKEDEPWATVGKAGRGHRNYITSLFIKPEKMYEVNLELQKKYREVEKNEVRYQEIDTEDADYLFVAYGTTARICQKACQLAREKGIKVGLLRPISLYPYPYDAINKLADKVKGVMVIEMNHGQMVEDVKLAVNGKLEVGFMGRSGGIIPTPSEILEALENKFINK
ncbi:MAG: 3-methyl-2-oxobutanoate dehydrogenase subunit VorB [Bacteroidetes bacterium 4572_128]|nr:MAG: 3-methyl-2-oxobutanoate dehydrogenase subunit VorB [Bacteroidetes bacterium 4572_128]